jgi:di/tricarboxylate transporter
LIQKVAKLSIAQGFTLFLAFATLAIITLTSDPALHVLMISISGIATFATRSLPEMTTALFIFLAFLGIDVVPKEVVFSGFATNGFWLLLAGLVVGAAITQSGLGDRVGHLIFSYTGCEYRRAVWFLSISGFLLGAFVPSAIPRVIVMMPITLGLAKKMGMEPGSRGHTGLLVAAAMMTLVPTYAFLTANLPTIVEVGAIELLYGQHIDYGDYFIQNAPINALRFCVVLIILFTFGRGLPETKTLPQETKQEEKLTPPQRRLLWILALAIIFWSTDSWHGIAPAWVALTAAVIVLLPIVNIFEPQAMKTEIDLSMSFMIGAVFCISAVMKEVGLGPQMAVFVMPALGLGKVSSLLDMSTIIGFSSALSHLTIAPATPIVLAPLAAHMSEATGWSIKTIAMAQNIGFSTTFLPYQSPPLLIGIVLARIPVGALTIVCLSTAIISSLIGIPLTWIWWSWLGII